MAIKFFSIEKGQYEVEINLNLLMNDCCRCGFEKQMTEIYQYENEYSFVSSIKNGILKYKSETLLPEQIEQDKNKQKLLFVFGNPANHSIVHGMFFFSNKNGSRHRMWSKLGKADVIEQVKSKKNIPIDARQEEASERKRIILNGYESRKYIVGMTTFYSFPTSADGGVKKVEELFFPIIDEIKQRETDRILELADKFTGGLKIIFVQKSSYKAFLTKVPKSRKLDILFWPIRGKGSSGENLKILLQG